MENVWNRPRTNPEAAASLAEAVARVISPFENRKRARCKAAQAKYDTTLATFADRIANVAMGGRSWVAQSFSNDILKRPGGPGRCLADIRDGMEAAGFIEVEPGSYDRASGKGRVTRIRGTPRFRGLAREHGYSIPAPELTTVLDGGMEPYPPWLKQQDEIVRAFNVFAAEHWLRLPEGVSPPNVYLVRKFRGGWDSGGRLSGGFWTGLPKAERAGLRIDGEPVTELDFRTMQPRILFGMKGLPLTFDPYLVPGFDVERETGKLVYNRLVNRTGGSNRVCPINFSSEFRSSFSDRDEFRRFVSAMEERLSAVSECFGREPWRVLQREESELLLSILAECMDRGIPAYPIHDSLIVKASDREIAKSIMLHAFKERYGVEAEVG